MSRLIVVLFAVVSLALTVSTKVEASSNPPTTLDSEGITLPVSGKVSVTTTLGELRCTVGNLFLESPTDETGEARKISTYGYEKTTSAEVGFFFAGTELVFAIQPLMYICDEYMLSTDPLHARLDRLSTYQWKLTWEDQLDKDFNDLETVVSLTPLPANQIVEQIVASVAFPTSARYQLPWQADTTHKVSQIPDTGEHQGISAYDFSGRFEVHAPEQGIVLWANNDWGEGNCANDTLRYRNNTIVLWTAADTQIVFAHLAAGSLKVGIGQQVSKGQLLAVSGNSGYSCAPHLHLEFQTACHSLETNVQVWEDVVRGRKSRAKNWWNCASKKPFSDGFWSGGVFYESLSKLKAYTNTP